MGSVNRNTQKQFECIMIKKFSMALGLLFLVVIGTCFSIYSKATRLPENRPQAVLNQTVDTDKMVVVCLGDSLTHGRVSHNYVDELDERFPDDYLFVNAGINSELAYNVLQRIETVIALKPDYITVLIGTNDALGTLGEQSAQRYIEKWNLPQAPDRKWFRQNLVRIVTRLKQETRAQIALLSLPPITENPDHPGYIQARNYSRDIRLIAQEQQLAYLPLHEVLTFAVEGEARENKLVFRGPERTLMYKALAARFLLGRNWDAISAKNGFIFLTDFIHLNKKGADIVADLIDDFVRHN